MAPEEDNERTWYKMLMEEEPISPHLYHMFGALPANPRCKICGAPFGGWGGRLMRMLGRQPSQYNPRFCVRCEVFEHPGGAEIPLTMLFADVRGSTALAEKMKAAEFSRLMSRFYGIASEVLISSDGMVDRLLGDEVVGLYIPAFAGPQHARPAIQAAQNLLRKTGHDNPGGPWLPLGIGVHTGEAFVGVVGGVDKGVRDFTALGDNVNITARLAASAGAGEILISEASYEAAGLDLGTLERRALNLKGKSEPFNVRVFKAMRG